MDNYGMTKIVLGKTAIKIPQFCFCVLQWKLLFALEDNIGNKALRFPSGKFCYQIASRFLQECN